MCTGFFKVLRGVNEVGIENIAIAGIPPPTNTATNGAPSLNKDFQMLMMSWIIISLVSATVMHYI